ncbi:ATP-dependent DNA helicase RecQ [Bifidobacterium sp. 64T4]|uniref:RecQ family ATP-dependent DNA helicase n=1 Tax=Bifidobacterium pongonis TaxID=2834432 RepID=UPI001C56DE3B|nr:ATP-dependent DNA helicase RecQ [Bifidobacterium pongonis]MBW3095555.1 ATP-dependent DNA helicase RecQ [Bifidobacterium pongonis]
MADITAWALRTLKQRYGYDSFRGRQLDVITAILEHRDVLAVMPTGAGKSLCYQIPACAPGRNGVPALVLVVTPLRALMRDQVAHLAKHGIPAAFIDSETTEAGRREIYDAAREGRIRLLYVAPERLSTQGFLRFAQSVRIRLLAVDEAHCVFQWGQDFRPDYLGIAAFVERLAERPVVAAFTASATPDVRDGIVHNLRLHDPLRVMTSFDRPNLYFGRREAHSKLERNEVITDYARSHRGESGIVYCTSRARTEELAEELKTAGVNADHFHARMDESRKIDVQNAFLSGSLDVIVATTAFGMGVDKPDVRWVINDGLPGSLEEYYQEAGRAGRDGKPASCLLLWGRYEFDFRRQCIEESAGSALDAGKDREQAREAALERCRAMERYCTTSGCLRAYMLRYFGEEPSEKRCGACDSCTGRSSLHRSAGLKHAQKRAHGNSGHISSFTAVSTYGGAGMHDNDNGDAVDNDTVDAVLAFIRNIHDAQGTGYGTARIVNALHGSQSAAVTGCGLDAVTGYGSLPDTSGSAIRAAIRRLLDDGTLAHGEHGIVLPADADGD